MILEEKILSLAEEALEGTDLFVVEASVSATNSIVVYLESDTSVTIDDCVNVSRFMESHLDRDAEDFELEVSSAGIDYPLKTRRQLLKHTGKDITVTDNEGVKKNYRLVAVENEEIEVQEIIAKKYGKLTKEKFSENTRLCLSSIKEIKPLWKHLT